MYLRRKKYWLPIGHIQVFFTYYLEKNGLNGKKWKMEKKNGKK